LYKNIYKNQEKIASKLILTKIIIALK
jgi:hypothetical protein